MPVDQVCTDTSCAERHISGVQILERGASSKLCIVVAPYTPTPCVHNAIAVYLRVPQEILRGSGGCGASILVDSLL